MPTATELIAISLANLTFWVVVWRGVEWMIG